MNQTPRIKKESSGQPEMSAGDLAWKRQAGNVSLPEVHRSIVVPGNAPSWRKMLAFAGPGFLVAVGYMDPGNWATDLAGGAQFGYTLLAVILISNLMAILLQHLCVKLGVATGRDLAQACRDHYSKPTVLFLWVLCEMAIAACDLAEVVGSAIASATALRDPAGLGLRHHRASMCWPCCIFKTKAFAISRRSSSRSSRPSAPVSLAELFFAKPSLAAVLLRFCAQRGHPDETRTCSTSRIGILGATVMPHNLYLHSSIVQTRKYERTPEGKREAIKFATIDSTVALMFALFINAAILILSAAAFHWSGHQDVAEIQDAYRLLSPTLGVGVASTLFARRLARLGPKLHPHRHAGRTNRDGRISELPHPPVDAATDHPRHRHYSRRVHHRLYGESKTTELLVASQVVLSMQLGFAVWPLMRFTGEKAKMDEFANPPWIKILGWTTAASSSRSM